MAKPSNVISLPKTTEQARRFERLAKKPLWIKVSINVLPDPDSFREQRAWRILFGLFQDCASIRASRGFKKTPGLAFTGSIRASRLTEFLHEAVPYVSSGRAEIHVKGERVRKHLLHVLAA